MPAARGAGGGRGTGAAEKGPGDGPPSAGTAAGQGTGGSEPFQHRPCPCGAKTGRPSPSLYCPAPVRTAEQKHRANGPCQMPGPSRSPILAPGGRTPPGRLPSPAPSAAAGSQRGGGEARSPHIPPGPLPLPDPPPGNPRHTCSDRRRSNVAEQPPAAGPPACPHPSPPPPGRDAPRCRAAAGGEEKKRGHRVLGFHLDYRPCSMGVEQGRLPPAGPGAGVSARERKAQKPGVYFFFLYF